jgi:hypothetical protein
MSNSELRASEPRSPRSVDSQPTARNGNGRPADFEESLREITDALRTIRNGSLQIIVQDGVIVQIDRTEKRRLR